MSFIGIMSRNLGEGLLQEQKWLKDGCITKTPPQDEWWPTEAVTWSTAHSLQAAQQAGETRITILTQCYGHGPRTQGLRVSLSSPYWLYIHGEGEDYCIWSVSGTSGRAESFPTTELYVQCFPHWLGTYHVAEDELELLIFPSHTRSIGSTKITLHLVMWCRGLNSGPWAC